MVCSTSSSSDSLSSSISPKPVILIPLNYFFYLCYFILFMAHRNHNWARSLAVGASLGESYFLKRRMMFWNALLAPSLIPISSCCF